MKIFAILVILFIGLLVSPVEAHHKDGHDQGGGPTAKATMTVTPTPVTAGQSYQIHGTGFDFDHVHLSLASPGCCSAHKVFPVGGEFDFVKRSGAPGTYTITAIVHSSKSGKLKTVATLEFEVQ